MFCVKYIKKLNSLSCWIHCWKKYDYKVTFKNDIVFSSFAKCEKVKERIKLKKKDLVDLIKDRNIIWQTTSFEDISTFDERIRFAGYKKEPIRIYWWVTSYIAVWTKDK